MQGRSTKNSQALLCYAVSSGDLERIKLLLNLGLELNFQDDVKETPLFYVTRARQTNHQTDD